MSIDYNPTGPKQQTKLSVEQAFNLKFHKPKIQEADEIQDIKHLFRLGESDPGQMCKPGMMDGKGTSLPA